MAPILIGIVPFGLVAGAAVIHAGFGMAEALGMSLLVNAGASQIVATTLSATERRSGSRWPRRSSSTPGCSSTAPRSRRSLRGARRLRPLLGHMLVDQNYASTMTKGRFRDDVDVIPYYMGCWLALASVWQVSNIAGALLGPLVPASWGLDFAVPLVFLAMLAPAIKDRTAVGVAVVTGVAAAVLVPLLPMQSGLVVAIVAGMVFGAWRDRPTPGEPS